MAKTVDEATMNEIAYFDGVMEPIVEYLERYWELSAKPKGYDEFFKGGYTDYAGIGDEKYNTEFNGLYDSTASKMPLSVALEIPHVAYGEVNQGRDPIRAMLGALVSYGWQLGMRYNELESQEKYEHFAKEVIRLVDDIENSKVSGIKFKSQASFIKKLAGYRFPDLVNKEESK